MKTTLGVATILFAFACTHESARPATSKATDTAQPRLFAKKGNFVGEWRGTRNTAVRLTIRPEGKAYVIQDETDKKYVGTEGDGVLHISGPIGNTDALYAESTDHLIVAGEEYERFDPVKPTISDMRTLGTAIQTYAAENQNNHYVPDASDFGDLNRFLVPKYIGGLPRADGWGNPYFYTYDLGEGFWALVSSGPDGKFDASAYTNKFEPGENNEKNDDIVYAKGKLIRYPPGVSP
jgi:hypothetical protein